MRVGGVALSSLVEMEEAAYLQAGYSHRAEKIEHFSGGAFRGSQDTGPLGLVIIAAQQEAEGPTVGTVRPLSYFDFFLAKSHLSEPYANAAEAWLLGKPGLHPSIVVVSKMVADPDAPRDRRIVALPGMACAAVLQALADANSSGIFVETEAQQSSQRLVFRHLRRYIPGLEPFWHDFLTDEEMQGKGAGGRPARMLGYVPPSTLET